MPREALGKHVATRFDDATIARIDAVAPLYSEPWYQANRSDVLRALVLAGLAVEEPRLAARSVTKPSAKPKRKK